MTDDELQAIKDRCVAASPRAWHATRHICREEYSVSAAYADVCSIRSDAAHCGADALFIAHARTDIPALLEHIEHLQRQYTMPCPYCDFGSGQRGMDRCQHCDGSGRMDVHVFVAQQRDAARTEVEGVRAELAKATADKATLVEVLEDIAERFLFQSSDFDSITLTKTDDIHIRAVLASVKGEV